MSAGARTRGLNYGNYGAPGLANALRHKVNGGCPLPAADPIEIRFARPPPTL
jgi:hypothetical protein